MKNKLLTLELGRFIAALLIMLSHMINYIRIDPQVAGANFLQPFSVPQPPSVAYFFVLSGFVMMVAHGDDFGRPGATLNFFWRRACRIYPAYWVALIVPFYLWHRVTSFPHFLDLITLVPRFSAEYVGVAWTLRYEMAFYLFFGLGLLPVVGRYIFFTWVALVLILWLPAGFYLVNPPFLEVIMKQAADGPVTRLFFDALDELFFFGMLAGLLYRRLSFTRRLSWGLLLAAAVLLTGDITIGGFGFGYGSLRAFVLGGTGFGALMLGLAGLEETGVLRLGSLCRALGKLSYPLYVIHDPAISLTFYLTARFPSQGAAGPLHAFVMMLALTFIGTLILTYLIDQPLQNFLRGLTFSNGIRGRATPANK